MKTYEEAIDNLYDIYSNYFDEAANFDELPEALNAMIGQIAFIYSEDRGDVLVDLLVTAGIVEPM